MVPRTTRQTDDTTVLKRLYLAFELSNGEWKLGTGSGAAVESDPSRQRAGTPA